MKPGGRIIGFSEVKDVSGLRVLEEWAARDEGRRSYEVQRTINGLWKVRVDSSRWSKVKRFKAETWYAHEDLRTAAEAAIRQR